MEFAYDGGGMGKGGTVTLYFDGKEVGKGRVDATQPFIFSADETTDIGSRPGTTVTRTTRRTPAFNGTINRVQIDLGEDAKDTDHYIIPTNVSASRWRDSSYGAIPSAQVALAARSGTTNSSNIARSLASS